MMTPQHATRTASLTFLAVIGAIVVVLISLMAVMYFGLMGGTGSLSNLFAVTTNMMATPS